MTDLQTDNLPHAMRNGMRRLASGVCIIASIDDQGQRFAMTASSVTSVSDMPPSLLVCVHKDARINTAIAESQFFSVNVLGDDQQSISQLCASPDEGEKRFSQGDWLVEPKLKIPYLTDSQSAFICALSMTHIYGTHNIYIGDIEAVSVHETNVDPLIYVNGGYAKVGG